VAERTGAENELQEAAGEPPWAIRGKVSKWPSKTPGLGRDQHDPEGRYLEVNRRYFAFDGHSRRMEVIE
jgi:hypothetical protein